jgi:GSH-dependent disulfide-bond oxidoreductase
MHRRARLGRGRGSENDRASYLVDAERAEGVNHAGRSGAAIPGASKQFHLEFLAISPNNKIPAIIDADNGLRLMESGAILLYLAEKTGKLWPQDFPTKWRVVEWLMWQMGGPGPFLGQVHHFVKFNPGKSAYAEERYTKEARRLWSVLDRRLAEHEYVADDYSIADIAIWPWISRFEWQTVTFDDYPNVKRWYVAIAARPAVQRA